MTALPLAAMEAEAEIALLRSALRKLSVRAVHHPAQNWSTVLVGHRCLVCETGWELGQPEAHAPDCIVPARLSTSLEQEEKK